MASLPVRRVVLYKHGVGYFEREGSVDGDQTVELSFQHAEVSDVLKSLTVLDLDGGHVAAVNYDGTAPLDRRLAEVALTIPSTNSLVCLLGQLQGARVRLRPSGGDAVEGTVLGIDTGKWVSDTTFKTRAEDLLSVLIDGGGLRSFALHDLPELQLLDDHLRRDLDYLLATLLASKKKDMRGFKLFARGTGKRTIRASYVVAAPVWKATYRILLNDADTPPMIQGWAVVDNAEDADWQDVELTLVAGLPISFRHDLYTPRHVERPEVAVRESNVVMMPHVEAALDEEAPILRAIYGEALAAPPPAAPAPRAAMAKRSLPSSTPAQVVGRAVGDLFEYKIAQPVTIRRDQSALVPIVLTTFGGRAVLLYQERARPENPLRCVEFKNTTGLTLEGGPVTVLERGSYVGEAMLDTLKPGEERLVPYAVELGVKVVATLQGFEEKVTRVTIRKGVLKETHAEVKQTTYLIGSKAAADAVLFLDHPRRGSAWKLVDGPAPHETTANHWRYKLTVPAGQAVKLVVKQRQPVAQTHSLVDIQSAQLSLWLEQKYLDGPTEEALRKVVELRLQVAGLEERAHRLEKERDGIHREQGRIRENLTALGDRPSEKELRERYVGTLAAMEDKLDKIEDSLRRKHDDRERAREQVAAVLGELEYEGVL